MAKKKTYEEIKNFIEHESKSGCKLITSKDEYTKLRSEIHQMALAKLKVKCRCGEIFYVSFNTFKSAKQRQCKKCGIKIRAKQRRYVYEDVKKYIELKGCKLISEHYENYHSPLKIQCRCGNIYERDFATFKGRKLYKCPICAGVIMTKNNYDKVYNILKSNNITLLSKKYINNKCKLNVSCSHGHIYQRSFSDILKAKFRCPYCDGRINRTTESLKEEIESLTQGEYNLLGDFKSMNEAVLIKHNVCGKEYLVTPHNFIDGGTRCSCLQRSKAEEKIEKYLFNKKISFETQYTFPDLYGYKDLLRFDFAVFNKCKKLLFLLEYDGEFHYKKYYNDQNFDNQQEYDKRKNNYCKKNNIPLIRIPYWQFDNIEKILVKELGKYNTK